MSIEIMKNFVKIPVFSRSICKCKQALCKESHGGKPFSENLVHAAIFCKYSWCLCAPGITPFSQFSSYKSSRCAIAPFLVFTHQSYFCTRQHSPANLNRLFKQPKECPTPAPFAFLYTPPLSVIVPIIDKLNEIRYHTHRNRCLKRGEIAPYSGAQFGGNYAGPV